LKAWRSRSASSASLLRHDGQGADRGGDEQHRGQEGGGEAGGGLRVEIMVMACFPLLVADRGFSRSIRRKG
jgi:hypothetical protein